MNQSKQKGPKTIPSQVQLPGGVILKGLPFKIVEYNPDGSPKLFELQPPDTRVGTAAEGSCVLFASETLLRNPWPDKDPSSST